MTVKLIIYAESGIKSYLKLASANDIVQVLALLLVYLRIEDRDRVSIFLSQKLESSIFKKFDLFDHSNVNFSIHSCLLCVGSFLPPHSRELLTDIPLSPLLRRTRTKKRQRRVGRPPARRRQQLARAVSRPCGRRKGIRTVCGYVCSLFASSLILRNMSHDESRPEAIPRARVASSGVGFHPVQCTLDGWMDDTLGI